MSVGEFVFEETNLLLTMQGGVGTDAGNPMLNKMITEEVKGNSSTHWKGFNDNDVDR